MDLPRWVKPRPMLGSDAQAKWGRAIRQKKAEQLQALTVRVILLAMRPRVTEEVLASIHCVSQRDILVLLHTTCQYALSCNQAKYWIEHRDEPVHVMIVPSMHEVIEHFKKTQPFRK